MQLITYSKQFLTGILQGVSVPGSLTVVDSAAHSAMLALQEFTKENPGADTVTGDKFWIYNVGSPEIARHTQDAQCDVSHDTMLCKQCGADHSSGPCHVCGGVAFHQDACAEVSHV